MSDSAIVGQAYGRRIHAREVVAIDEAGDGLCWARLPRFGDDWLLIRSDARDVSRGTEAPPDTGGRAVGSVPGVRAVSLLLLPSSRPFSARKRSSFRRLAQGLGGFSVC